MKKIFLPLLFVLACFVLLKPSSALATSGACSYHSGVNCSAGPDTDGSVICNDGSRDSSVQYSQMDECQNACTPPDPQGYYTDESYCKVIQSELIKNGSMQYATGSSWVVTNCEQSVAAYQAQVGAYNACIERQNQMIDQEEKLLKSGDLFKQYCDTNYGVNSTYDASKNDCVCNAGYELDSSVRCVAIPPPAPVATEWTDASCTATYGDHVHPYEGDCYCDNGYDYSQASKSCLSVPVPVASQLTQKAVESVVPSFAARKAGGSSVLTNNENNQSSQVLKLFTGVQSPQASLPESIANTNDQKAPHLKWYQKILRWFGL